MILSIDNIEVEINGVQLPTIKSTLTAQVKSHRSMSIDFTWEYKVDKRSALVSYMTTDDKLVQELCCALLGKDYPFVGN